MCVYSKADTIIVPLIPSLSIFHHTVISRCKFYSLIGGPGLPGTVKAKAVPLHAMKALVGRGFIAPTHSRPGH
jgi:hypothetical protein